MCPSLLRAIVWAFHLQWPTNPYSQPERGVIPSHQPSKRPDFLFYSSRHRGRQSVIQSHSLCPAHIIAVLIVAHKADKLQRRFIYVCFSLFLGFSGPCPMAHHLTPFRTHRHTAGERASISIYNRCAPCNGSRQVNN